MAFNYQPGFRAQASLSAARFVFLPLEFLFAEVTPVGVVPDGALRVSVLPSVLRDAAAPVGAVPGAVLRVSAQLAATPALVPLSGVPLVVLHGGVVPPEVVPDAVLPVSAQLAALRGEVALDAALLDAAQLAVLRGAVRIVSLRVAEAANGAEILRNEMAVPIFDFHHYFAAHRQDESPAVYFPPHYCLLAAGDLFRLNYCYVPAPADCFRLNYYLRLADSD